MSDTTPATAPCAHQPITTTVSVAYLEDRQLFMADIKINCGACGMPFSFLGVDFGVSLFEPMASIDGTELRIPIKPGAMPIGTSGQFQVRM